MSTEGTPEVVIAQQIVGPNGIGVLLNPHKEPAEYLLELTTLLGTASIETRVAALLSIEDHVAKHPKHHLNAATTICTYVKRHATQSSISPSRRGWWPFRGSRPANQSPDIRIAFMVLGRLRQTEDAALPRDLCGIHILDAQGSGADLRGANLEGASLCGAALDAADLRGANLVRANLRGANLKGAKLDGADLEEANLDEAALDGASLRAAHVYAATLRRAWIVDVDLHGSDMTLADLDSAIVLRADFSEANLMAALLPTSMTDVTWSGAWYSAATTLPPDVSPRAHQMRVEVHADREVLARVKTRNSETSAANGRMAERFPFLWGPPATGPGTVIFPRAKACEIRGHLLDVRGAAARVHAERATDDE